LLKKKSVDCIDSTGENRQFWSVPGVRRVNLNGNFDRSIESFWRLARPKNKYWSSTRRAEAKNATRQDSTDAVNLLTWFYRIGFVERLARRLNSPFDPVHRNG
jgi:hypothetical protein